MKGFRVFDITGGEYKRYIGQDGTYHHPMTEDLKTVCDQIDVHEVYGIAVVVAEELAHEFGFNFELI